VSRLTSIIKSQYTPSAERKEYVCPRCKSEWTQLEVLSHVGAEGFECQKCGGLLISSDEIEGGVGADRSGHEKNSKLMAQLDTMLKLLKQIDSVEIPPNDFDTAWDHKIDIELNRMTNPTRPGMAVSRQPAVRGISKTDAATVEVSLTSSAEKSAAEQAQEAARKAALEKQNALPIWHTESTVKTEAGNIPQVKREIDGVAAEPASGVDIKPEIQEERKPEVEDLNDTVAAYYAEMEREKERVAKEDESEEEEDDEEDEDEFEDVGVMTNGSSTPQPAGGTPALTNGSLKRELESDSGSSGPNTDAATPITPADDGPAAKRVKFDIDVKKEEESDEEDEEFEDV
jgi:transcription initiation factor TFIIE subunit alpha